MLRSTVNLAVVYLARTVKFALSAQTLMNARLRCFAQRKNAREIILLLVALTATSSCAKPIYQTAGTVGPLRWQAVDVENIRRTVDGQESDGQEFTLVLRESQGVGITFNHVEFDTFKPGYETIPGAITDRLELPAHCELYLTFSSTGVTDPIWTITLTGNDERGRPVKFTIDLVVSAEPSPPAIPAQASVDGVFSGLSLEERRRLQIVTAEVDLKTFENLFLSREGAWLPLSGAAVVYDSRVQPVLRRGLRNVVASLVPGTMGSNSILTLVGDLSPYGGAPGGLRIIHSARDPKPGRCAREILIETLDLQADGARVVPPPNNVAAQVAERGFRMGSGWSESERLALGSVLDRIPHHLLARIEGLSFNRGRIHPTKPKWSGEYDSDAHAITMFDNAFTSSLTRSGSAGTTTAAHSIAHEIGHAFDFTPLRLAIERERFAVAEFDRAFGRYETPPGSGQYQFPPAQRGAWDNHMRQVTEARRTIEAARSTSGTSLKHWSDTGNFDVRDGEVSGEPVSEFGQAAAKDGHVRITKYAETDWHEYFAECFSLYVMDPQFLEWLRPNIYRYFAKHFPQEQSWGA